MVALEDTTLLYVNSRMLKRMSDTRYQYAEQQLRKLLGFQRSYTLEQK